MIIIKDNQIGIVVPVEAKDRDDVCDKISRETGAVLIHPFNGLFLHHLFCFVIKMEMCMIKITITNSYKYRLCV